MGDPPLPPAWKLVPHTGFAVDAFRFPHPSIKAHFLTHAHSGASCAPVHAMSRPRAASIVSEQANKLRCDDMRADHYTGLSEAWCGGLIYCSQVTAALVALLTGVSRDWLVPLEAGAAHMIHGARTRHCAIACRALVCRNAQQLNGNHTCHELHFAWGTGHALPCIVAGVRVMLGDANHAPGAVQFLFELPSGRKYLHCGDMRYQPAMQDCPVLARARGADAVFLDTTYARPRHEFPPQVCVCR
jgi:DNA ligase 1